jgi:hypothetical protein
MFCKRGIIMTRLKFRITLKAFPHFNYHLLEESLTNSLKEIDVNLEAFNWVEKEVQQTIEKDFINIDITISGEHFDYRTVFGSLHESRDELESFEMISINQIEII